jgi:tetratricopeptide (TPR) repeat protein
MPRILVISAAVLAAIICSSCARQTEPTADEAFETMKTAYSEAETPEDKVRIAEEFITAHPDSEQAAGALGAAVYNLEELGDLPRARALVETTLAAVDDPEIRFEMKLSLWKLARKTGEPFALEEVAAELTPHRELGYVELADLIEAAVDGEAWQLVEEYSTAALALATPDAFRADYPDREFTDEEVEERGTSRRATTLASGAWALVNQDRADEAMAMFEEADAITRTNYVGIPETPLYRYWGQASLAAGEIDRAEELLLADAVMGDDSDSVAALRQIYVDKTGSAEGFDEYLWSTRQRIARAVDDFTLPNYDDEQFALSSTNGKVVLLAFWFPT